MSRRRGEFEHRTSIFEGAFRAWSHLGGLDPITLETKIVQDLDPLNNPLENDTRLVNGKGFKSDGTDGDTPPVGPDGKKRREYPYEPLPRSGLAHPFVQAILSPWLGPDAEQDAIQLGLTTLRTWWQHRRKGESGSAIAALGTDKMRGVVEGYTRHFFNLAHCLVVNDGEQPPRTLHTKLKEAEKQRNKRNKKRAREEEAGKLAALALNAGLAHGVGLTGLAAVTGEGDDGLTPLERLHATQRQQLMAAGHMVAAPVPSMSSFAPKKNCVEGIDMTGKCNPGMLDLPEIVEKVNAKATQLAYRGGNGPSESNKQRKLKNAPLRSESSDSSRGTLTVLPANYGDPETTPVVLVADNGDIMIVMDVDGITCGHCVKIVETVLKGCQGSKSPITGLLDAAADMELRKLIIKLDFSSSAKRVAFEAARNLAMVGYTARVMELGGDDLAKGKNGEKVNVSVISTAFEVVAATDPINVFDWKLPCSCPDNGIMRQSCAKHSQMNQAIFDIFQKRMEQVTQFICGCGYRTGGSCTCGPNCQCQGCDCQNPNSSTTTPSLLPDDGPRKVPQSCCSKKDGPTPSGGRDSISSMGGVTRRMSRNNSLVSYGGHFSMASETTFRRAMSGLSALSIDWENLEDFDVNVDHSAHINNNNPKIPIPKNVHTGGDDKDTSGIAAGCAMLHGGICNCGPTCMCVGCPVHDKSTEITQQQQVYHPRLQKRSSLRKNNPIDPEVAQNMQVSFKV